MALSHFDHVVFLFFLLNVRRRWAGVNDITWQTPLAPAVADTHNGSPCNQARAHVEERVWLESNLGAPATSKARTRELTYRALVEFIEKKAV